MVWLFVAFIVLPVVEIWLITQAAGQIGWLLTLFLVIFVSAAGAWLVRREGLGVIRRVRENLQGGKIPTDDLADGAMIFFASALMLTPGFLTDGIGLALLIPPIRAILRPPVVAFFRRRLDLRIGGLTGGAGAGPFGGFGSFGGPRRTNVYDVDDAAVRERPSNNPEDGPQTRPELD